MAKEKSAHISTLGSQVTSVISVALVLLIVGILSTMALATRSATDAVRSNIGIVCRLQMFATDDNVNLLKRHFSEAPFSASFVYTSPDDVLEQEMEYNPDILDLLDENPYSGEFDVKLKPAYANSDSIRKIVNGLESLDYVEEAVSQADAVDTINSAFSRILLVLGAVALALLVISIVLINNTVSLSVYSRRFIIHTMKLVGATAGFIRKPFVVAGIVSGVIAAVIASALLCGSQLYVRSTDLEAYLAAPWSVVAAICGGLLVLGVLICGVSALLSTNRYIASSFDEMNSV